MRPVDPRLLRYARGSAVHLAACVAFGLATAGLVVAQAGLLAHALSGAFHGRLSGGDLRAALLWLAAVVAGRVLVAWGWDLAAVRAAAGVKAQLRRQVMSRAVALGPRALAGQRSGEVATLVTRGLDALDPYLARYLPQLVLALVVPLVVLARIAPVDLVATATIVVTLPLIPVFMVLVGQVAQERSRRRWRALAMLGHHFLDVLRGLETLKVFGRAKAQAAGIARVSEDYRRETMAVLRVAFLSSLVLELLATLSVALVAVGIGLRLVQGQLDLETALLVLILAPEAYLPLRQVGAHYHAATEGLAAAHEAFALLDTPPPTAGHRPLPGVDEVRVQGVRVVHPGRDVTAPAGADLVLRRGEVVALAGPSGSGKTTLLHVLLGLCRPDAGRVLVAGAAGTVDLVDVDLAAWRARVGWVAQDPVLVIGTLAANVALGRPGATVGDVAGALRRAGLDPTDPALPGGLDTLVGERGAGLSAGQRRRVALARAYLRDPAVLLLDEPSAGLDAATEAYLLAGVRAAADAGAAVLVVAHRGAALAAADRVVTLPAAGPRDGAPGAVLVGAPERPR